MNPLRKTSQRPDGPAAVLLTPFNGGLAVARHLVRAGVEVAVLAGRSDSFVAHTRGVEGRLIPDLPDGREEWLSALGSHAGGAVLTGGDVASAFLATEREALEPSLRTFESQDDVHRALMGKLRSYEIATAAGVRIPWTFSVSSSADLERVIEAARYPCVLKPDFSHLWRAVFGEDRVLLANDRDELERHGRAALEGGLDLLVCEYVPGDDTAMEEAIVVRAADGSYPVAFGCGKLRQHPSGFGAASLCEVIPGEESLALARSLLDHAGFVGVAGIETKRHSETGDYYFIEANVRIPTQFGLGDAAGGDSAWRMYAALAGMEVGPQPPLRYGVRLLFPELELQGALRAIRGQDDSAGPLERLRSYRGVRDWGIADLRDPGPALHRASNVLRKRTRQRTRRVIRRG